MEFVRFIFSSPWIWLGFIFLLAILFDGIAKVISAFVPKRIVHYETNRPLLPEEQRGPDDEPKKR